MVETNATIMKDNIAPIDVGEGINTQTEHCAELSAIYDRFTIHIQHLMRAENKERLNKKLDTMSIISCSLIKALLRA